MEDFNELDLEELNTKDKYAYFDYLSVGHRLKWKLLRKHLIYEYSDQLRAAGFIDDDGEVQEDKECEFEFVIKYLSGESLIIGVFVWLLLLLF